MTLRERIDRAAQAYEEKKAKLFRVVAHLVLFKQSRL